MARPAAKAMMPISDRGNSELSRLLLRAQGFTLIEVVVVLLLMGIVSALVVANIAPDDKKELRLESDRLAALFEQASMDARADGNAIAWTSDGNGYVFQEKSPGNDWVAKSDDIYRPHKLPADMRILAASADQPGLSPGARLVFNPSGINLPFDIILMKRRLAMKISGDTMNRMTVGSYHLGQ